MFYKMILYYDMYNFYYTDLKLIATSSITYLVVSVRNVIIFLFNIMVELLVKCESDVSSKYGAISGNIW